METKSLNAKKRSIPSVVNIGEDLAKLLKYQREYEAKFEVKVLPNKNFYQICCHLSMV